MKPYQHLQKTWGQMMLSSDIMLDLKTVFEMRNFEICLKPSFGEKF